MGGKKSKPNEPKQTDNRQTPDNRQIGCIFPFPTLCSALYLRISAPIFVPISMPVQVYRSVTTITHLYKPYPPPPYLGA